MDELWRVMANYNLSIVPFYLHEGKDEVGLRFICMEATGQTSIEDFYIECENSTSNKELMGNTPTQAVLKYLNHLGVVKVNVK